MVGLTEGTICLTCLMTLVKAQGNRCNKFKLIHHHFYCDLTKFNFTNRVIPIWNSLSNHVVSVDSVNTFKNRLDHL